MLKKSIPESLIKSKEDKIKYFHDMNFNKIIVLLLKHINY